MPEDDLKSARAACGKRRNESQSVHACSRSWLWWDGMGWVGIKVVDGMHTGQSPWVGIVSGDAGALPEYKVIQ